MSNPFPGLVSMSGSQQITGTCSESTTIGLRSGNLMLTVPVVGVQTIGLPLQLTLYYNSVGPASGPLGNLWQHDYMSSLAFYGSPTTNLVVFTNATGMVFNYVLTGTVWGLDQTTSHYFDGVLTNVGTTWYITRADGTLYTFNSMGQQTAKTDVYGNILGMSYTGSNLTAISDPSGSGRQIQLGYTGSLMTSIIDPNGNETVLGYDTANDNLTSVTGPDGCTLLYTYADPSNHLITARTDGRGSTYSFSFDGDNRLTGVVGPDNENLLYTYDTVEEIIGDLVPPMAFNRTTLTAPRGTWEYRFDPGTNLWRTIDPLGHWRKQAWDQNQRIIYATGGFMSMAVGSGGDYAAPRDNLNNATSTAINNGFGYPLYVTDETGIVTQYVYASNAIDMIAVYPGQGNKAVEGNWVGEYGEDGYVLCTFNSNGTDLSSLPSYVRGITLDPSTATRYYATTNSTSMDPRAVVSPDSPRREVGFWKAQGADTEFSFYIELATEQSFNLSFYTSAADTIPVNTAPLVYNEQWGRNAEIFVTDLDPFTGMSRTRSYFVDNNAPGVWVTFPVHSDALNPITVTVEAVTPNTDPRISAVAFDPYDDHSVVYTYNSTHDVLTRMDGVNAPAQSSMTYNTNGTVATSTDAKGNETQFFYLDANLNLTKIVDAASGIHYMTYDANGNTLSYEDPNGHLWQFAYDGKNRLVQITDPLSNTASLQYDSAGNRIQATDANGNTTRYVYTLTNRLVRIIDALGQSTSLAYDAEGNPTSLTDADGHTTHLVWDAVRNLVQVVRADGTTVENAYDALNRLKAVTLPNGTQSDPTNFNLLGAANFLLNPGAETVDPFSSTGAWRWTGTTGSTRDTTVSHSGSASLNLDIPSGPSNWQQAGLVLPPGVTAVLQYWARPDGTSSPITVQSQIQYPQFNGLTTSISSPPTALATSSTTWQQTAPYAFDIPGDIQHARFTVDSVSVDGSVPFGDYAHVWLDDFELNVLSTGFNYDNTGRLLTTQTQDSAVWQNAMDRYGRRRTMTDPKGHQVTLAYDGINQIISVTDALGNVTRYGWDAVGNLVSVIDSLGNLTQYQYDVLNRLVTIIYPDLSTELFSYDPASNLATYTNNRSQSRALTYDNANRLTEVLYNTDSTTVLFAYDNVGNVLSRTERNRDLTNFFYDALYRLVGTQRGIASGSPNAAWVQRNTFDAVGNRLAFNCQSSGGLYGTGEYGTAEFGNATPFWTAHYDVMNRPQGYQDALGNYTGFTYDVEGRLVRANLPNGLPGALTEALYDLMGRVMALDTHQGATDVFPIAYGYDGANNRVAASTATDTFDYGVDASNRLISESTNRFVERTAASFAQGTQSTLDSTAGTPTVGALSLLAYNDDFSGGVINADRWRVAKANADIYGFEVRQNDGLGFAFPRGYAAVPFAYNFEFTGAGNDVVVDIIGFNSVAWAGAQHRLQLPASADFEVIVDFFDFQGGQAILMVHDTPLETYATGTYMQVMRQNTAAQYVAIAGLSGSVVSTNTVSTTDTSGKLRITRTGGSYDSYMAYYWDAGTSAWVMIGSSSTTLNANAMYMSLVMQSQTDADNVSFQNFQVVTPSAPFVTSGLYTSTIYDAGRSTTWNSIQWEATVPSGAAVEFQVAVSSSYAGPFTFVGPDGTSGTYFTSSGTALYAGTTGQFCQYQATLTGTGSNTPVLNRVDLLYTGTNDSTEVFYTYDGAGNILVKVTESPDGGGTVVTETRAYNALNQLTNNAINTVVTSPPSNTTVNWGYQYDLSGNLLYKTTDTEGWMYVWDEDNRLLEVWYQSTETGYDDAQVYDTATYDTFGSGTLVVSYTYDVLGRMLTRTDSGGTTQFVWSGMDCVMETDPAGVVTRYYTAVGGMMAFDRTVSGVTSTYQVHSDSLGSVRKVTDSSGSVVATYDTDAWGNALPSTSDSIPNGGLQYRFVGALGIRLDVSTGLFYMRARWCDPALGRFISRDPLHRNNRYDYALNNPTLLVDPTGRDTGYGGPNGSLIVTDPLSTEPDGLTPGQRLDAAVEIAFWGMVLYETAGLGIALYGAFSSLANAPSSIQEANLAINRITVCKSRQYDALTKREAKWRMSFLKLDDDEDLFGRTPFDESGPVVAGGRTQVIFFPPALASYSEMLKTAFHEDFHVWLWDNNFRNLETKFEEWLANLYQNRAYLQMFKTVCGK